MTKKSGTLLVALALLLACCGCKRREETLSLLVWEGYADDSIVRAFEQGHHCKVVASYMGSSDELVAKLRGGSASSYDVISPSSDVAATIARANLAAPLDLSSDSGGAQRSGGSSAGPRGVRATSRSPSTARPRITRSCRS